MGALGGGISRDPIGERGGLNLHCFVENAPIGYIDPLGAAAQGTPPKTLPPDPPVTPPPGKPDSGWNCAGCAFRDYLNHDLDAVKQKLSKCRKLGSCAEKCKAGECKFWLWEYDSQYSFYGELAGKKTLLPPGAMPGLNVNPKVLKGDFHIAGGNVDPKSGEDLPNVPSKMGASPCKCASNETDFGKNWKPKAEEEITRRKGHLTDPDDRLQDLVVILKRLNIVESCYCCPGMK